jgi:hypothetical protein
VRSDKFGTISIIPFLKNGRYQVLLLIPATFNQSVTIPERGDF